jgi:hypothetical protein
VFAEGIDAEHVRVIHPRHGARLLRESGVKAGLDDVATDELDGDTPLQPLVHREQHHAHGTSPELADQPIAATDQGARSDAARNDAVERRLAPLAARPGGGDARNGGGKRIRDGPRRRFTVHHRDNLARCPIWAAPRSAPNFTVTTQGLEYDDI